MFPTPVAVASPPSAKRGYPRAAPASSGLPRSRPCAAYSGTRTAELPPTAAGSPPPGTGAVRHGDKLRNVRPWIRARPFGGPRPGPTVLGETGDPREHRREGKYVPLRSAAGDPCEPSTAPFPCGKESRTIPLTGDGTPPAPTRRDLPAEASLPPSLRELVLHPVPSPGGGGQGRKPIPALSRTLL
jgi:hypothetical protein